MSVSPSPTRRKNQKPYEAGGAGTIEVVQIDLIKIDHLYQRDLNAEVVEKIAREYDIVTAGTIVLSRRPSGDLYVVDGQHRLAGASLAGEKEILAQIVDNLTPEEEAKLRVQGNYSRPDRINEVFRARVFAGDPVALHMQEIAGEFGSAFNYLPEGNSGINAIGSAEAVYKMDGGKRLRRTLAFIDEVWGGITPDRASAVTLKGITFFLDRHESEVDMRRLKERVTAEGVGSLLRMARNHKAALGGSLWVNFYRALVEVYNYNLRESHRLEWRTSRSTVIFHSRDPQ